MDDRRLTDLELERWLVGDLPEPRRRAASEADRARLEALRAEHAAWLATVDVAAELRAIEQRVARAAPARQRWRPVRWVASAGAVAAAAAVVLLLVVARGPAGHEPRDDDDLRTKGDSVALIMYVAGAEGAGRRLATGDPARPGDRVRFEVRVPDRGYVAIVGIDGPGNATIYYPFGGHEPAAIDPSGGVLPGAIALDATPGVERFYAVYAARPFALDPALVAGLQTGAAPRGVATASVALRKDVTP